MVSRHGVVSAAICIVFMVSSALAQPEGWKMTDRFHGFRYEIFGNVQHPDFLKEVQDKADDLACFGWVQNSVRGTVVGEVRCNKYMGPLFQQWMREGTDKFKPGKVELLDYPDTKIKLHFSHFKILEQGRKTCFREPPHQCREYAENGGEDIVEKLRRDEL